MPAAAVVAASPALDSVLWTETGAPMSAVVNRRSVNKGVEVSTSVQMRGNERKFGFSIYGGANASLYPRIDGISPDSPSSRADVEIGDEVLAVNGNSLQFFTHQQIITAIHKSIQSGNVSLLLKRDLPSTLNGLTSFDSKPPDHLRSDFESDSSHKQPISHLPAQTAKPSSAAAESEEDVTRRRRESWSAESSFCSSSHHNYSPPPPDSRATEDQEEGEASVVCSSPPSSAPSCAGSLSHSPHQGCKKQQQRQRSKKEVPVSLVGSKDNNKTEEVLRNSSHNSARRRSVSKNSSSSSSSHTTHSSSGASSSSSPAIPLPLPALTSWKSRDELNQLNSFNLQAPSHTTDPNPQTTVLSEDSLESKANTRVYELDVSGSRSEQNYQRKYRKRAETEQLNCLSAKNENQPPIAASLHEDSTTLDFDLTTRQRNYPQTHSPQSTPSKSIHNLNNTQQSAADNRSMLGTQTQIQSDRADFMLTSEPIVSRQPFIDAAAARGGQQHHAYHSRHHLQPGQQSQFREMPIDCPGEDVALTYPYEGQRSPLPPPGGQLNGVGYHTNNMQHSASLGTHFSPSAAETHRNYQQRFGRTAAAAGGGIAMEGRQNVSSPAPLMYDERHTETTSIDVDSPDEGPLMPGMYDTSRSHNRSTPSTHNTQHLIHLKDDMQYKTDFSQVPSFISRLPRGDSSTDALQRTLNSDVFRRSLVHFDAINRFNSAVSTQSKSSVEGEDAASSTCGERLFTPASQVTFNRPSTAPGGSPHSTSPNRLPTTLQVQQVIRDSREAPSDEGIELYRVLDEHNMQAVLQAHEHLVHKQDSCSPLQQKAAIPPPLKPKPPKTPRDSSESQHNGEAPLVTSLHNSTLTARMGGTLESSLATSDVAPPAPPEVIDKGDGTRLVILQKSHHPLGATILKDGDCIKVGRIVKGGIIEASGVMQEGEEIVQINEIELHSRAMSVDDVCDILASLTGKVHFLLRRHSADDVNGVNAPPSSLANGHGGQHSVGETYNARTNTATSIFDEQILHIRALFDFNPDDDEYVPCRDLGIPFDRGTVLHVMSTHDPLWWQAFPDHVIGLSSANESAATAGSLLAVHNHHHTLAGLIPSKKFWRKREALRLMIEANEQQSHESFSEKKSGGSAMCCSNRRRRHPHHTRTHLGGGPHINPSALEVLTYEEVGLFRPEEAPPRPVILVGPSKIGRHELRQRLYVRQPEYFGFAVPHTTRPAKSAEQDGVDYHFVSRKEFETELNNELIVDFHDIGKHLYGTSVKAIQHVMVKNKKSCVLSLHPKSIQALRDALLMPFVVFIAPPNLESLRNVSREIGNTLKDGELRAVIEEARVLDLQYGHLFDDVIINSNLDQCFQQLSLLCEKLRTEPQWVPVHWLGRNPSPLLAEEEDP